MNNNQKDLEETRKLNMDSRNGKTPGYTSSTDINNPDLQEARELNSQASRSNPSLNSNTNASTTSTSTSNTNYSISTDSTKINEIKKQNEQSRQNKGR